MCDVRYTSRAIGRLCEKVSIEDRGYDTPCWVWTGFVHPEGYGRFSFGGTTRNAHRISYTLFVGDPGNELDHLCRVRQCVNPAHLEPVTHLENVRRGANAPRTHCHRGHEFIEDNIYWRPDDGTRMCRACRVEDGRRRYLASKAAA